MSPQISLYVCYMVRGAITKKRQKLGFCPNRPIPLSSYVATMSVCPVFVFVFVFVLIFVIVFVFVFVFVFINCANEWWRECGDDRLVYNVSHRPGHCPSVLSLCLYLYLCLSLSKKLPVQLIGLPTFLSTSLPSSENKDIWGCGDLETYLKIRLILSRLILVHLVILKELVTTGIKVHTVCEIKPCV